MNIELVALDDILDELTNRFDSYVFIALKRDSDAVETHAGKWQGSKLACIGMCEFMKKELMK